MQRIIVLVLLVLVAVPTFAKDVSIEIPEGQWSISFDSPSLSVLEQSAENGEFMYFANSDRFNISIYV